MKKIHAILLGVALSGGFASIGAADDYPSRPITMVVPFAAGGPTDTLGRIMADAMGRSLGKNIIVEDVTGAAGSLGVGRVARAPGDGYTLCVGQWNTFVVNGAIYALPYDLQRDFEPIALLPNNPLFIDSKQAVPANSLAEFIAWIKANEATATFGTAGVGSSPHIAGVYFQKLSGTRFQFVPYRGGGPALLALEAGQIDILIDQASNSMQPLRDGRIKAYAVTAKARLAAAPDIPTVDEAGLPGLYINVWFGLWAPKGTPHDIIARLNRAAMDAMADSNVQRRFADLGLDVPPPEQQSAEALGALQKAEIEKWWPIIKAAGITAE
jgi:tripartite-type tricarboxylate transporter receptor subunit TctC